MGVLGALTGGLGTQHVRTNSLALTSPRMHFALSVRARGPISIVLGRVGSTGSVIRRFVLLTGVSITVQVGRTFPSATILHHRPDPPTRGFTTLGQTLRRERVPLLRINDDGTLTRSLSQVRVPKSSFFGHLMEVVAAQYVCRTRCFTTNDRDCRTF